MITLPGKHQETTTSLLCKCPLKPERLTDWPDMGESIGNRCNTVL